MYKKSMKNLSTIVCSILCLLSLWGCKNQEENAIQKYIKEFIEEYPKATLQDIYKGSFQDVFGPAHMLSDRESVKRYILHELEEADVLEGAYYEPCGWKGNFYRINLKAIKDKRITADELTDAFMESANGIDTTLTPTFINEWQDIQQAIRIVAPKFPNFQQDSTLLANLLKEGKYVVHHSPSFDSCYQPHYRIVRKDVFEKNLLKKLEE